MISRFFFFPKDLKEQSTLQPCTKCTLLLDYTITVARDLYVSESIKRCHTDVSLQLICELTQQNILKKCTFWAKTHYLGEKNCCENELVCKCDRFMILSTQYKCFSVIVDTVIYNELPTYYSCTLWAYKTAIHIRIM